MKYFVITLHLIWPYSVFAQIVNNDEIRFEQLIIKAGEQSDSAHFYFTKAQAAIQNDQHLFHFNNQLSQYYIDQRQFDSAALMLKHNITRFTSGQTIPDQLLPEVAMSYLKQDLIHKMKGEFNLGNEVLTQALELIGQRVDTAKQLVRMMINTGENYRMLKDNYEAEKWLRKALNYAEIKKYPHAIISANNALGNIYEMINVKEAENHYLACIATINEYGLKKDNGIYMNLGLVYKQQLDYSRALKYFKMSSDLLGGKNDSRSLMLTGNIDNNTANVMLELTQYDSACYYYQRAIQNFDRSIGENHPFQVYPRRGLIAAYPNSRYDLDIQPIIKEVLKLSRLNPDQLGLTYMYLGDYYLENNSLDTALAYYDSTMITSTVQVNKKFNFFNHNQVLGAIAGILKAYNRQGNYTLERLDIQYEKLLSVIQEVQHDFNIQFYIEIASEALDEIFNLYLNEYEREPQVLHKLWTISQINKGIKLKNQLRKKLSMALDPNEEIFLRERQLKDSIDMLLSRLNVGDYDELLVDLERRNEQLLQQLESQYPRYYGLKYRNQIHSIEQIQSQLENDEILLNFFQGQDHVYLIRLSKNRTDLSAIPKDKLDHWVTVMNEGIFEGSEQVVSQVSKRILRACLIDELENTKIRRIHIVPDGIVWKLNFAALTAQNGKYLGNEMRLSYHYYLQKEGAINKPDIQSGKVLAFSYNDQSSTQKTGAYTLLRNLDESLPGTSQEVMSIAQYWDGNYYYGAAANESVFKASQGKHSIMHLAVHGVEDENNPENSYLKFARNDSLNDGRLYAYELYDLDNQVNLAVLTACNSGTGKLVTGEGMMSLGHAFMYAGASSVLASRWEVPDISAPHLMKYFYQGLKEGMDKSAALTFAQNKFLNDDADNITSSPFYWSGFYVLGDDKPVRPYCWEIGWKILIPTITLFLLLLIYWRRRSFD